MKYDHERLPTFISNTLELTLDILKRSDEYGIQGNIELDQGYSFLYQIAIFFPMLFQKQVIKTTFKPYDSDPAPDEYSANLERVADFNGQAVEVKPKPKFEDDKEEDGEGDEEKGPGKAPLLTPLDSVSDLKLNPEYKNIINPKLKISDWLQYCSKIVPEIKPYMKRQVAILNNDNSIDLLLQCSYELA